MVDAVVFDIGNVLLEWHPERFYDGLIGQDRRKQMFAEVDLHVMNDLIDLGSPFAPTVQIWARKYPAWRDEIMHWHDSWVQMAAPVIPRSIRLLRALRANDVPVFALTNFGVETFALARTHYDFLDDFDRAFVSGQLRMAKPDPTIFETLEQATGYAGDQLLFADDRADNIAAAHARGWKTYQFDLNAEKGAQEWADHLVRAGLLTAKDAV